MERLSWKNPELDMTVWGEGPWSEEEISKIQWEDTLTGMPCLAVRSHFGNWCGYVGVTIDHPLYGIDYNECARRPQCPPQVSETGHTWWDCDHQPGGLLEVHGGITYSGECQNTGDPATGICHVPAPGDPENIWWLGFDCGHYDDTQPGLRAIVRALGGRGALFPGESYKTLVYVQAECATLCDQLDDRDFSEKYDLAGDVT